ncbi:HdeA/HdeB family chaperone [Pinirhizobacter soli]|uniref:HdeA/HdeB family chaperone n=1 Tax=Pinirhizobacter soli TaxID=2786953 RepID=UPI00202A9C91|nr:HdeA/HdeB family chaperone [Pinirhizobacter soli]
MKRLLVIVALALLATACHRHAVREDTAPAAPTTAPALTAPLASVAAPATPAVAASVPADTHMTLVARRGDIALENLKCGEFVSRINRDSKTHTAEIQTMLTWLFGYASARNGIGTIRTSAAGPFVDELTADCQTDPSQPLLPVAVKAAAIAVNAPISDGR